MYSFLNDLSLLKQLIRGVPRDNRNNQFNKAVQYANLAGSYYSQGIFNIAILMLSCAKEAFEESQNPTVH